MNIGAELKKYRKDHELSQKEMAEKLGLKTQQAYAYYENQKSIDVATALKFSEILGVSLLFSQKNFVSHGTPEDNNESFVEKLRNKKNHDNPYLVPFIDIPAQAGYIKAYDQIDYIHTLKKYPILPDVDPHGAIWRYFQIDGESMEPEFRHGDVILTSQVPKDDWVQFNNLYSYVVVTDNDLWFKDVDRVGLDGKWILLSQNENHEPFTVNIEDVKQLWVMRRHVKARAKKHRMYNLEEIRKKLKRTV